MKVPEQLVEQLMPAGELVMVSLSSCSGRGKIKSDNGRQIESCRTVTVGTQSEVTAGAVGAQPVPAELAKTEPVAGAAVTVTAVPLSKFPEQVVEQLIPAGELVMVALPVPALVTQ